MYGGTSLIRSFLSGLISWAQTDKDYPTSLGFRQDFLDMWVDNAHLSEHLVRDVGDLWCANGIFDRSPINMRHLNVQVNYSYAMRGHELNLALPN